MTRHNEEDRWQAQEGRIAEIRLAALEQDSGELAEVRALVGAYLRWVNARLDAEYGVHFDAEALLAWNMENLGAFRPPNGRLYLAQVEGRAVGLAGLTRIGENVAEIKRMYVRPAYRGRGIGRALLDRLLADAREMGVGRVRLDTARFMDAAQALYRSAGFREVAAGEESEIPAAFRAYWVGMAVGLERRSLFFLDSCLGKEEH